MRPDPQDTSTDRDVDRIIYLGDVRRRKVARRRQAPDRHYLAALGLVAAASWAVWLTVVFSLQPARLLTYVAFFAPFAIALAATCSIALYLGEQSVGRLPVLGAEVRRGVLVSAVVVFNAGFQAAHRWSIAVLGISLLLAIAAEAIAARRQL